MRRKEGKKKVEDHVKQVVMTDPRTVNPKYSPEMQEKIEGFKDLKFGFFVHYGLYSEAESMESGVMCKQECGNGARTMDPRFKEEFDGDYDKYVNGYLNKSKTINPSKFNANKGMDLVESTGCKYFTFTSRHHDGYALFDSKYTDFKITGKDSKNKIDMLKELFTEAEKRGIGKGLYYSPANGTHPDGTGPYYYDKDDKNLDHNQEVNVDPVKGEKFTKYFDDELTQLLTEYGKIDCIGLDSNGLRPDNGYDLHMDKVAPKARELQENLLIIDRGDHRNEDYGTPEQTLLLDPVINMPWESVVTLGNHGGYVGRDQIKDEHGLIDALLTTISNGGNLNIGIGPKGDGSFPEEVVRVLGETGKFVNKNAEGIYSTRPIAPYNNDEAFFTTSKDEKTIYAFVYNDIKEFNIPEEFKTINKAQTFDGVDLMIKDKKVIMEAAKKDSSEFIMIKLIK